MRKLREVRVRLFSGEDRLTLQSEINDWLKGRDQERLVEPIEIESVGSTLWAIVQYTEG